MAEMAQAGASTRSRARIVAAFAAIYLIWGTTFLAIRVAVETIPPFLMAGLRFFLAGAAMFVFLLSRGERIPAARHWRTALITGGLMLLGGIGLISYAEQRIPSGLAGLMAAFIPIWITSFEWLIFRGKRPGAQTLIGLAVGFGGAILLFAPSVDARSGADLPDMLIALAGTLCFALGSLVARRAATPQAVAQSDPVSARPRRAAPESGAMGTALEMLAGGALLLVFSAALGEPARLNISAVSTRSLIALAYLTVFGSIITYTAYLWLLRTVEPAVVSTNFYVNPVVAVVAGWLVLGETITPAMGVAAAVIVLGVAIMTTPLPRKR